MKCSQRVRVCRRNGRRVRGCLAVQERCDGNWEMAKVAKLTTFRGKSSTVLGDCTASSWGQKRGGTECSLSHGSSEAPV